MWKMIWKENGLVVEFGSRRKLLAGGRCGTKAAAGGRGVGGAAGGGRSRSRRREEECQPSFGVAAFSPKNGGTSFQVWNGVQLRGADSNKIEMRSRRRVQGSWRRRLSPRIFSTGKGIQIAANQELCTGSGKYKRWGGVLLSRAVNVGETWDGC